METSHKTDKSDNPYKEDFPANKAAMLKALELSYGVVSTAVKKAGIHRSTHYQWLKEDEAYRAAAEDVKNVAIDLVESEMFKQIKAQTNGSASLIKFYLTTVGKNRGYQNEVNINQRTEVSDGFKESLKRLSKEDLKQLKEIGEKMYGDPCEKID
jgi:short subunit dehydrogenase-like uncharacterized protein